MLKVFYVLVFCQKFVICRAARDEQEAQTISVAELHTSSTQKQHQRGGQARRGEEFGSDRPDAMDAAGATGLEQGSVQARSFSRPARRLEKLEQREHVRLERQLTAHIEAAEAREALRGRLFYSAFAADPDTKKTEPPADNTTSSQDAFKKAGEDSEKVKEDVAKLESATHDAQEKSKSVDKDFAKYDDKMKKMDDVLKRLAQKTFRWRQEVMQFFADAEGDKYSPLMAVKLDRSRDVRKDSAQDSAGDANSTHSTTSQGPS